MAGNGGECVRFLYKFNDGQVIDSGEIQSPRIEGQGNFLQMLLDYKKDPEAVVQLNDKIVKKFTDLHSVEIILD